MKKFLLYAHGGSGNHGAEAIIKETIKCIRTKYSNAQISISTHFPEQDEKSKIHVDKLISPDYAIWESEKKEKNANKKLQLAKQMYSKAISEIESDTVLISVGGDNFCYENWHRIAVFQEKAKLCGAKSILWGASIEPSMITTEMADVLNTYTHIIARESLTYDAVRNKGVKTNVILLPDIAFGLPIEENNFSNISNCIGINLSPLIIRREASNGIVFKNFIFLTEALAKAENNIVFIPHVDIAADNDTNALKELYKNLSSHAQKRVTLLPNNMTASQYKYVISKCKAVICSRTHVSIAAYSTAVPTLVIGYSVKAKGIALDLGMKDYIIDINELDNTERIFDNYKILEKNSSDIRKCLSEKMVNYIPKISEYKNYI